MTKIRHIELAREVGFNTEHAATNEYLHQFAQRVRSEAALERMAENARELGLDYEPVQAEKEEPVTWSVFAKHGRIYFSIGNQSFPVEYTPEDEPDCSAEQAAEWYMDQLRHALTRLSDPQTKRGLIRLTNDERVEVMKEVPHLTIGGLLAVEAKLRSKNT